MKKLNMDRFGIECFGGFEKLDNVLLVHFKNAEKMEAFAEWLESNQE